jgi:hypothetical protein
MRKWASFICAASIVFGADLVSGHALAQERCVVADPTGTPLNVRSAPAGQRIVDTLSNGTFVAILDRSSVDGRTWAYVRRHDDRLPLGWVFRDYLNCNVWTAPRFDRTGSVAR